MGSAIHINKALAKTREENTKTGKASTTHSGKAVGKPSRNQSHNIISKTSENRRILPRRIPVETPPANSTPPA
jgi:hypothetical protein